MSATEVKLSGSSCYVSFWLPSDISEDSSNPTYSVELPDGYSCRVTKWSQVYLLAVRSKTHDSFPPHCGLLLKNNFIVTDKHGTEHTYQYGVIHGLSKELKGYETEYMWIHFYLCQTEEAAYRQLESVGPKGQLKSSYRGKTGGWTSPLACSKFVEVIQAELLRKFSTKLNDLYTDGEVNLEYSNCALCAARLFCAADCDYHTYGELFEIKKLLKDELNYEVNHKWMRLLFPMLPNA